METLGLTVRPIEDSGDQLRVHRFEPVPYIVIGLASLSRFFAAFLLIDLQIANRRDEWLAQHEADLARARPRFIVDFSDAQARIQARLAAGYRLVERRGRFVLLQWH